MKILLIGNLPEDRQESMLRFQTMMERGLTAQGHSVISHAPRLRLARMKGTYAYSGLGKYLGYWDKFVLYPRELRRLLQREQPDAIHIVDHANACYAAACPARSVVTCHDLQQIRAALGEIPHHKIGLPGKLFQKWILGHIRRTPLLACVSNSTAQDLVRVAGISDQRVCVVANALNDPFAPIGRAEAAETVNGYLRDKGLPALPEAVPLVLNVGGGQWYKNRPGMLRIFAQLRTRLPAPPLLIMVGKPLSATDGALAAALGVSENLIQLSGVPNPVLNALYSRASALLFPSFEEGFGWPIAEAQACGCPVLTSDRSPMREIAGPHSVLFDPEKPEQAAERIATDWTRLQDLGAKSLPLADRWRTETMIQAYEALYARLAKGQS